MINHLPTILWHINALVRDDNYVTLKTQTLLPFEKLCYSNFNFTLHLLLKYFEQTEIWTADAIVAAQREDDGKYHCLRLQGEKKTFRIFLTNALLNTYYFVFI